MAIRLKELPSVLVRAYVAGQVNVFIDGKPGIGKTQTIEAFVERMKERIPEFRSWPFYAPTMSPMDIQASAPNYETHALDMFSNTSLPNAYTDPDAKGVVFFGELLNTDPATAKLLQKYINGEDMNGCLRKPKGVMVVGDGNRLADKSGVQQQGRAFLNRFMHIPVFSTAEDNMEFALKHNWHDSVQTFFRDNPALIDNYDEVFETAQAVAQRQNKGNNTDQLAEEGRRGIWANMRGWERISGLEYAADQLNAPLTLSEVIGNVGAGVAAGYMAHKKMLASLVTFEEIMTNPEGVSLPESTPERHALAMRVALRAKIEQMPQVYAFAQRISLELQAVILRTMLFRPGFKIGADKTGTYTQWVSDPKLSALLNGR